MGLAVLHLDVPRLKRRASLENLIRLMLKCHYEVAQGIHGTSTALGSSRYTPSVTNARLYGLRGATLDESLVRGRSYWFNRVYNEHWI